MTEDDLAAVRQIAGTVHPDYPEDAAVFAERLALYPAGCRLFADAEGRAAGYALTHPWRHGAPPKLDTLLGAIPADADTYYLHDIALLPWTRGRGAATGLLADLARLAREEGFARMSLVAVNASRPVWERRGFSVDAETAADLASYGGEAWFMTRSIDDTF
ncbi:GNAT family N-acetyltransferase [Oleispirillum naphthae]|uniref:GNAT family N-acetyltransferase n=1 Tax=Oleispirillum naphthae TaxID=2838853 RepID=UPI00308231EF